MEGIKGKALAWIREEDMQFHKEFRNAQLRFTVLICTLVALLLVGTINADLAFILAAIPNVANEYVGSV